MTVSHRCHPFRQGWAWFERTSTFSGIQFTKRFIEFVFVETNKVVRSNTNVIMTRQTCGQRSSRVAGSKRRALAFCFPVRIWYYVFLISICRGKSDLGVFMTSVLAKRMRPRSADFQFKNVFGRRIRCKSTLRSRILFASTEVEQINTKHSSWHFHVFKTIVRGY